MQRPQHHVLTRGDQQPQRHQHRRHGQHLKQIAFFMGTLGDQEQQRHQRGSGVPEEALLAHAPQAEKHHHHHGGSGNIPHAPGREGVADHGRGHGQQQGDLRGEQQRRGGHAVKIQRNGFDSLDRRREKAAARQEKLPDQQRSQQGKADHPGFFARSLKGHQRGQGRRRQRGRHERAFHAQRPQHGPQKAQRQQQRGHQAAQAFV